MGAVAFLTAVGRNAAVAARGTWGPRLTLEYVVLKTKQAAGRTPRRHRLLGRPIELLDAGAAARAIEEIFIRQDYRFDAATDRPLIVDCGSNIGISVLYFKTLYPRARVLAFEADPETASVLRRNVASLDDVRVEQVALGDSDAPVNLYSRSSGSLLASTRAAGGSPVEVPGARLSRFLDEPVDLLKVDVEGAEERVLRELAESGKLALVRELILEFHRFEPGDRVEPLLATLEAAGFRCEVSSPDGPEAALVHAYSTGR